jgi:hypothetical protein
MQLWRMPHANIEQDLVLAVTDIGRVATVWVVKRDDPDGVTRARNRSAEAQRDVNALSFAFPVGKDDAAVWPVEVRAAVRRRWSAERDSTTFGLDGEPGPRRVRSAVRDDTLSDFVPARGAGPDVELSIVDEKDSAGSRSL